MDIFFVISGYLITSIIIKELQANKFSILKFYERRFRRILPALCTVIFATLAVGSILLHPSHLIELGESAIATTLFSSNILFYMESGYFDSSSDFKPLLHTWSLAVEEQYYIFIPLFLLVISKKYHQKYTRWLIVLALFSFVLSVLQIKTDPIGAFFLIPSRTSLPLS